jgi:hypothetical protein
MRQAIGRTDMISQLVYEFDSSILQNKLQKENVCGFKTALGFPLAS